MKNRPWAVICKPSLAVLQAQARSMVPVVSQGFCGFSDTRPVVAAQQWWHRWNFSPDLDGLAGQWVMLSPRRGQETPLGRLLCEGEKRKGPVKSRLNLDFLIQTEVWWVFFLSFKRKA